MGWNSAPENVLCYSTEMMVANMAENQSLSVLLCEDSGILRIDLEDALEEAGFNVHLAISGDEAIDQLSRYNETLCALITDIQLGDGPNGWDVGHRARELQPAVPIIYMSGDSAADWSAQGVPQSIMLQKPFVNAQLITALSTLLNQRILGE